VANPVRLREELTVEESQPSEFQFEIEQAFLFEDKGTAISGLVELGTIVPGQAIDIHGQGITRHGLIDSIVMSGERTEQVEAGHVCTLLVTDLTPGHIGPWMLATHAGGQPHKDLRERVPRQYSSVAA
jgi:translation elongation factor EF-Tu-like GTPase